MDADSKSIIETLHVILEKMATKDDLAPFATKDDLAAMRIELKTEIAGLRVEMHQEFASLRDEIRDIHDRLDAIEAELKSHAGYAKEIDHLFERVAAIEKHLGITRKIAA